MHFVDLYPQKGTFPPGEAIQLFVEIEANKAEIAVEETAVLNLTFFHLIETVGTLNQPVSLTGGKQSVIIKWKPTWDSPRGYGVKAELQDISGQVIDTFSTAFDVLPDWTSFPRYGFLTDFTPDRRDISETVEALTRFHINGLQFYDWQYRHDQLLPPATDYIDPLGRTLSLTTIKEFIEAAHERGMAAMPYLAVYAASIEFWRDHPEWGLYDGEGQPHTFEDFLGLMDPTAGSPWINHLLEECRQVVTQLSFDGLHVDQYGDPKAGFNANGVAVDIPLAFTSFIEKLKSEHPQSAVIFNAVGNWPIKALATAPQDFVYIEIWPPDVYYHDIWRIVAEAREMSGGKAVVIALYLPASQPENVRLADALIFSLGGSRIELGEQAQLLADPYFPKHQALSAVLKGQLRRCYDFVVRYGNWLGPGAAILNAFEVVRPSGVWVVVRAVPGWIVINLINLSGLDSPRWDEPIPEPVVLSAVSLGLPLTEFSGRVWWASPDEEDMGLSQLSWTAQADTVSITLPRLDHWAIVAIELNPTE